VSALGLTQATAFLKKRRLIGATLKKMILSNNTAYSV
jgi:hypothetical protein